MHKCADPHRPHQDCCEDYETESHPKFLSTSDGLLCIIVLHGEVLGLQLDVEGEAESDSDPDSSEYDAANNDARSDINNHYI